MSVQIVEEVVALASPSPADLVASSTPSDGGGPKPNIIRQMSKGAGGSVKRSLDKALSKAMVEEDSVVVLEDSDQGKEA